VFTPCLALLGAVSSPSFLVSAADDGVAGEAVGSPPSSSSSESSSSAPHVLLSASHTLSLQNQRRGSEAASTVPGSLRHLWHALHCAHWHSEFWIAARPPPASTIAPTAPPAEAAAAAAGSAAGCPRFALLLAGAAVLATAAAAAALLLGTFAAAALLLAFLLEADADADGGVELAVCGFFVVAVGVALEDAMSSVGEAKERAVSSSSSITTTAASEEAGGATRRWAAAAARRWKHSDPLQSTFLGSTLSLTDPICSSPDFRNSHNSQG